MMMKMSTFLHQFVRNYFAPVNTLGKKTAFLLRVCFGMVSEHYLVSVAGLHDNLFVGRIFRVFMHRRVS